MRPTLLTVLGVLLGLSLSPYPAVPAVASCAAPSLSIDGQGAGVERVELVRGEVVTVSGWGFVDGCDDSGQGTSTFGCSGDDGGDAEMALTDVELFVLQGQPTQEQTLGGVADAGTGERELGWVSWTFTVPETVEPGPANLKTAGSEPLRVRIVG